MTAPRRAPELVPARMLNEHTYCPRLAYLEWVQGDFADNADTIDGKFRRFALWGDGVTRGSRGERGLPRTLRRR
jgi:hypothetical protein